MPGFLPHRRPGQDQNLALQLDALQKVGCDKIYQEKASGVSAERPELGKLLDLIREGDTLVIWKLDRLGRSLAHLIGLVADLERRQVGLLSLNDPVDTTTAQGRLVFRIFASLAEFDRTGEPAGSDSGANDCWSRFSPPSGSIVGTSQRLIESGSTKGPYRPKSIPGEPFFGGADRS